MVWRLFRLSLTPLPGLTGDRKQAGPARRWPLLLNSARVPACAGTTIWEVNAPGFRFDRQALSDGYDTSSCPRGTISNSACLATETRTGVRVATSPSIET